jgi:inner membrane protein
VDSLTQAALGAAIGGAIAPAGQRRKALLAGAALGTLPDLDVFIDYGDAVANFTYHRGFSHSLFVLPPLALLLWLGLRRWWAPVADAPARWLAIIFLALVTHPLLDAHTAYGTQLLWPLDVPPTQWATLFIIDPLFTLPLLVGVVVAAIRPANDTAIRTCLVLSTLYLGWSWVGQATVASAAYCSAAASSAAKVCSVSASRWWPLPRAVVPTASARSGWAAKSPRCSWARRRSPSSLRGSSARCAAAVPKPAGALRPWTR